ncbi:cyclic lactone autoinducer peptide [Paenibacillus sp. D9]|nr:cyclic lactone autoinducer peptide [Paenibacillus sp. D9]
MKNKFISAFASVLSLIAMFTVSTASAVFVHQGDTPEELLK